MAEPTIQGSAVVEIRAPGKDVELKLEGVKTKGLTLTLKETWEAPKRQQSIPVGGWSTLRILTAAP